MSEGFEREPSLSRWPLVAALVVVFVGVGLVVSGPWTDEDRPAVDPDERGVVDDAANDGDEDWSSPDDRRAREDHAPAGEALPGRPDHRAPDGPDERDDLPDGPDLVDVLPGKPDLLLYALTQEGTVVEAHLGTGERRESSALDTVQVGDAGRIWVTDELVVLSTPRFGGLSTLPRDFEGDPLTLDDDFGDEWRTVLLAPDRTVAWAVTADAYDGGADAQQIRPIEVDGFADLTVEVASPFTVLAAVDGGFVLASPDGASYLDTDGTNTVGWPGLGLVHRTSGTGGAVLMRRCDPRGDCELWRASGPTPQPVNLDDARATAMLHRRGGLGAIVSDDGSRAALVPAGTGRATRAPVTVVDLDSGEVVGREPSRPAISPSSRVWGDGGSWLISIDHTKRGAIEAWAPDQDTRVTIEIADSSLRSIDALDMREP